MPEATTLLLIRHGETEWNQIRRIQGFTDIPLAPSGHYQAVRLAWRFTEAARHHRLHADAVYSSDLMRAMQTATPLADALGLAVQPLATLRERHFGIFEGCSGDEVRERWPEEYARWAGLDADFAPSGGESARGFHRRIVDALSTIASQHVGGTVACIAHGGVLDCAYRYATGLPLDAKREHPLLNASVNVVELSVGEGARVVTWADVRHLEDDVAARDEISPA